MFTFFFGPFPLKTVHRGSIAIFCSGNSRRAVCPWNKFASLAKEQKLAAKAGTDLPPLVDLLRLDDAGFRQFFAGTPVRRACPRGPAGSGCCFTSEPVRRVQVATASSSTPTPRAACAASTARRLLKAAVRRSADLPSCWKSVRVTLWVTRDQLRLASQLMGFNKVLEGLMLHSFQLPTSC